VTSKQHNTALRRNEQIRARWVFVIHDNVKHGEMSFSDALRMAQDAGLDLVEISPTQRPPVCSILDYGKYKYEQCKKAKERRKTHEPKEKEVTLRYAIDEHDLVTKTNQIKQWIANGDRVRIAVRFSGRENAHKDQGMVTIRHCLELLGDGVFIERAPGFEGKQIVCRVCPKKK
jgi:translation initiation factor IF-3